MAAACGSLKHIFDKALPETSSLLESLSSPLNQPKPVKPPLDQTSFTELFGELHFKESPSHASPSSLLDLAAASRPPDSYSGNLKHHRQLGDSLQLCTEGLGSESFADNEDLNSNISAEVWKDIEEKRRTRCVKNSGSEEFRRLRWSERDFPPPISCISTTGKPWVCFKSSRQDGRFVLTEVKIPTQEFLHACRENGRLTLQFVQHDEEIVDQEGKDDTFMESDRGEENSDAI